MERRKYICVSRRDCVCNVCMSVIIFSVANDLILERFFCVILIKPIIAEQILYLMIADASFIFWVYLKIAHEYI